MYVNAIVAFIDLIGFREMVRSDPEGEKVDHVLSEFLRFGASRDEEELAKQGDDNNLNFTKAFAFSDCIVRVRQIDHSRYRDGDLANEIWDLMHAIENLANQKVLVRGAVTVGKVFASEEKIFGPALVEAYELESKFAIYPRVILSHELIQQFFENPELRSDGETLEFEARAVGGFLRRDHDGFQFIDYTRFGAVITDEAEDYQIYLQALRDFVIEAANNAKTPSIKMKYLWLIQKLNQSAQEYLSLEEAQALLQEVGSDYAEQFPISHQDVPELRSIE